MFIVVALFIQVLILLIYIELVGMSNCAVGNCTNNQFFIEKCHKKRPSLTNGLFTDNQNSYAFLLYHLKVFYCGIADRQAYQNQKTIILPFLSFNVTFCCIKRNIFHPLLVDVWFH